MKNTPRRNGTRIEVGEKCIATGGEIKKLTVKISHFNYDGKIDYYFFNHYGDQVDLQNGAIDFGQMNGMTCDIWGDFLPPKTTRTGKIKKKFLVLRIQKIKEKESA